MRAYAALFIAMISIQLGASLAKSLFPVVGAQAATTLRLTFAALILCVWARPWRQRVTRAGMRTIAVYGVALGTMNLCFYLAIARIPLGLAVAIEFAGPLTVAVLSSRQRIDGLWAALALVGILLVLPLSERSASTDFVGALLALAAGLCWAVYILAGQRASAHTPGGTITAWGMVVAACVGAPAGIAGGGLRRLTWAVLPSAVGVAVLSSALPYSLEMIALKALPMATFGVLMSLEPACAALLGRWILKEHLTALQIFAIASIVLASIGSALTARRLPPVEIGE
jgi:inner membrane transporter RhtA